MTTAQGEGVRATDGRVPGRRGRATRGRLLECTVELLAKTSYRDIKVIDIAREAGTSPATFYQYFADVEQAILVLAEEMTQEAGDLAALVGRDWRGDKGYATAVAVAEGFMAFWERHRAVLRVVDLATEEGDLRFQQLRTRTFNPLWNAFIHQVGVCQREGRVPASVDPAATAAILVSMLAHVAAHRYGLEFWGVRTSTLIDSLARNVYWNVTGRKPPESAR